MRYDGFLSGRPTKLRRAGLSSGAAFARQSFALLVLTAGCAKVSVRKVPSPTQYIQWTDALQRQADSMEGFRFYLPRPFVNVFESFPVRTEIYLASGMVDSSGKFVVLQEIPEGTGLNGMLANPKEPLAIGWSQLEPPATQESTVLGDLVSGGTRADGTNVVHATSAATPAYGPAMPVAAESGKEAEGGTPEPASPALRLEENSPGGSNGESAFAYQPLRGNMDIVYLPDFEEQYVVSSREALDGERARLILNQGWCLQGFNSLADNSHLSGLIFNLIENASKTAEQAGRRALGFPIPSEPAQPAAEGATPVLPSVADPAARAPGGLSGSPVSLKIVVIQYAAKGLYPVIKPRELQGRVGIQRDSQTFALADGKIQAMTKKTLELAPTGGVVSGPEVFDSSPQDYTVPRYPYQYISFSTFRRLHVEILGQGPSEGGSGDSP